MNLEFRIDYILIAVVIILALVVVGRGREVRRLSEVVRVSNAEAKFWRDKQERSHAEIEVLRLTNDELKEKYPKVLDSIRAAYGNVKPKEVIKYVTIYKHTHDTVTVYADTVKNYVPFHYKDKWHDFRLMDDGRFAFKVTDSLSFLTKYSKKSIFSKRKYSIEAVSYNPSTEFKGIKSYEIIPRREVKRYGVGVMVGYGITDTGLSPAVTVGLYYHLF